MEIAALFYKLLALLVPICIGFLVGRTWEINQQRVAQIVYYFLSPVVILWAIADTAIDGSVLVMPLMTWLVGTINCAAIYWIAKHFWSDSSRNVLAMACGTSNAGYFGLPVAQLVFNEDTLGIYVVAILGIILYENSTAYYVAARGHYPARECIRRVLRLPTIHASWIGLLLSYRYPDLLMPLTGIKPYFFDTYAFFGMSIVGLGLSQVKSFRADKLFTIIGVMAEFLAWPLIVLLVTGLDQAFVGLLTEPCRQVLLLVSFMPMAANTVLIASLFKSHPEKVATTVIVTTGLAMFYVPVMAARLVSS